MNYCKEMRVITKDGIRWHIEYEHKTTTNVLQDQSLDDAMQMAHILSSNVDEWVDKEKK